MVRPTNETYTDTSEEENLDYDYDKWYEVKMRPSLFHPLWDGCELTIEYDFSVDDIIIHDFMNYTHTSLKGEFNGILDNVLYSHDQTVCVSKNVT